LKEHLEDFFFVSFVHKTFFAPHRPRPLSKDTRRSKMIYKNFDKSEIFHSLKLSVVDLAHGVSGGIIRQTSRSLRTIQRFRF
jgi:hypothetical protein